MTLTVCWRCIIALVGFDGKCSFSSVEGSDCCHCLQVALATTLQRIGGVGLDKLTKTKAASELLQVSRPAVTSCHICDGTVQCLSSGKLGPASNVAEHVGVGLRSLRTQSCCLSAAEALISTLCLFAAEPGH